MAEVPSTVSWVSEHKVIGGCRIIRELGRGGMGIVYLAEHLTLARPRALKTLLPDRIGRDGIARFLREARLCSRIEHPNVVTVFDAGTHDDINYITMQYIEGKVLTDCVRGNGGPLPWDVALRTMRHAVRGTAAVHRHNLVHRDIKPSNIMVSNEGRVVLMDFGLAREQEDSDLTASGAIVGTPAFMSPEQARGRELDKRSDVYSLGSTFYFLLTGKLPFPGKNSRDVLLQVAGGQRPAPIREVNPGVPRRLSEIVEKAMAPEPLRRFCDAEDMSHELGDLLRSLGTSRNGPASTWSSASSALPRTADTGLALLELIPEDSTALDRRIIGRYALAGGALLVALCVLAFALNALFSATADEAATAAQAPAVKRAPVPKAATPEPKVAATEPVPESMIRIPAGFVRLGNTDLELRSHARRVGLNTQQVDEFASKADHQPQRVYVPEFWIDKYEVTAAEYAQFVHATGHTPPRFWRDQRPPAGQEDVPVTNVAYADATAYAAWAKKKLPTSSQWVRAFRGDETWMFPWGDEWEPTRANAAENLAFPGLSPVGATPQDVSSSGVFNLVGNAAEMTRDRFEIQGQPAYFVKGTSFAERAPIYGVAAFRVITTLDWSHNTIGFRCVRERP